MADNRLYAQLQPFTLAGSGGTIGDATLVLTSMVDIDGNLVTMAGAFGTKGFGTIEPGSPTQEEQISFTGITQNSNGTATLTGVSTVGFLAPYTETANLAKSHAGGTIFVISNTSGFYNDFANKNDNETISQVWTFTNTVIPQQNSYLAPTLDEQFAPKKYVDDVAVAGAPNATTSVKGIVEIATGAELAAGTGTGGTGATVVAAGSSFTNTSAGAGDVNKVPVLGADGTIAQGFLNSARTIGAVYSATADNLQITTDANSANDAVRFSQVQSLVGATSAFTTGEGIDGSTTPRVVCIKSSDGLLYKADANDNTLTMVVGFVNTNALITTTPTLVTHGFIGGFTGLTQNATYYVSDTAGSISTTQSTTCAIPVGRAVSTTTLQINIGKRVATGSITHASAAAGTQDVTTTIGFRATKITLGASVAVTGSTSTGKSRATLVYMGTTQISFGAFNENDDGGAALTQANVVDSMAEIGSATGAWAQSAGGNKASALATLNSIAATAFVTRVVNTTTAGSGGNASATITFIAEE